MLNATAQLFPSRMLKMSLTTGCECDSTILAAMDMAAAPGTSSGCNKEGICVQVQALEKIHAQKVRMLMRSISELKKKLALAAAQGKDHRRSAMIRAMRSSLRQQELVIDVIKEELGRKAGMGKEETNDWVIRKTIGGPLRFRPKTREELQNELYQLEKKHRQTLEKVKARRCGHGTVKTMTNGKQDRQEAPPQSEKGTIAETCGASVGQGNGQKQSTDDLMQLSDALEEADALRVAVSSRDAALRAQAEAIDKLQAENRELRELQERLGRKERRVMELKRKNYELGEKHTSLLEDFDARQEEIQHLKAQLELRKEEAAAESEGFREQSLRQAEEVSMLLKREEELVVALEEETAARGRERRESHHSSRQAIQRAESAEQAHQEAKRQEKRLREQNMAMVAERQRLGKDAAEIAGLRERGRELAREVKRLTQEGDARQKRLEEARERSATAEEAFRASQQSFEQERASKESLLREADKAQELLLEEKALREAERDRLAVEVDARRKLEIFLASEREKEQVVQATADSGTEDEKRKHSTEGRAEEIQRLMSVKDAVIISPDNKLVPPLSIPSRDLFEEVAEDFQAQQIEETGEKLDATRQQTQGGSGEKGGLCDSRLPASSDANEGNQLKETLAVSEASELVGVLELEETKRLDPENKKASYSEAHEVAMERSVAEAEKLDSVGGDGGGAPSLDEKRSVGGYE